MNIQILSFGKIADLLPQAEWAMNGVQTVGDVRAQLEKQFPELKGMHYLIAVDKKMATDTDLLAENSVVALLPPFSGG